MFEGKFVQGMEAAKPALAVRWAVFVEEQGFSGDKEVDEHDPLAHHGMINVGGKTVAAGRLIMEKPGVLRIGRIAVLKEYRGQDYGDLMVRMLLDRALRYGAKEILVNGQERVAAFYERFGFKRCGPNYDEEGCPHVPMSVKAEDVRFPSACGAQ